MSEWTVVTVIVALVGLFLTIGKPIITLNSNIVKLNLTVEALDARQKEQGDELNEQAKHAHEAHAKIWEHEHEQDDLLRDHSERIGKLEARE